MVSVKEELLLEGLVDWFHPNWVHSTVSAMNPGDPESVRQQSIGVVAELISEGLVTAGDVGGDAWDCTPGDAIARITKEWLSRWPTERPAGDEIAWFQITDLGRKRGEEAWVKKRAERAAEITQ